MLRRRRTPTAQPPLLVEVIDARTGIAHQVTQQAYDTGLARGGGFFATVCGHGLLVASLTAAPDRTCPACTHAVRCPAARAGGP